jgi:hypothetical protein
MYCNHLKNSIPIPKYLNCAFAESKDEAAMGNWVVGLKFAQPGCALAKPHAKVYPLCQPSEAKVLRYDLIRELALSHSILNIVARLLNFASIAEH